MEVNHNAGIIRSETVVCAPFISSGPQGSYLNLLVKSNALTVELNPLRSREDSNFKQPSEREGHSLELETSSLISRSFSIGMPLSIELRDQIK